MSIKNPLISFLILVGVLITVDSFGCSSCLIPQSKAKVFGKNYDWHVTHGRLFVNRKHLKKIALVKPGLTPKDWVAKYPSLTFNQISEHAPMGGINSEGLAGEVSIMLDHTEYPEATKKPAINELQWIQFLLDTAADVKEAILQAKSIELIPVADYPVHYHFCDRGGKCAVFEYKKGNLVVYEPEEKKNPFVLTNSGFAWEHLVQEGMNKLQPPRNPRDGIAALKSTGGYRFEVLKKMVEDYDSAKNKTTGDEVNQMWAMLDKAKLYPTWQIVYELENGRVNFRTELKKEDGMSTIQTVGFAEFTREDLDCREALGKGGVKNSLNQIIAHSVSYDLTSHAEKMVKREPVVLKKTDFVATEESDKMIDSSKRMMAGLDDDMVKALKNYSKLFLSCDLKK